MNRRISSYVSALLTAALFGSLVGCAAESNEAAEGAESAAITSSSAAASPRLLRATRPVPGQYIVVLRREKLAARAERPASVAAEMVRASASGELMFTYEAALAGFAAKLSEAEALRLLEDPRVDYVEEVSVAALAATQFSPPWGLDRVDQRAVPNNGQYIYNTSGAGVHLYVIDTGIRGTHQEFTGRLGNYVDLLNPSRPLQDCYGHGTMVAGVAAGTYSGVAKSATVHSVRIYECSPSTTSALIVAGVDWVTANHVKPAVANMSLRDEYTSATVDTAVSNSINAGVTYVVAAGNLGDNACNFTPSRVPGALTVAASDPNDNHAVFGINQSSSHGPCVDLYAPGVNITSAGAGADNAFYTLSGTSFAAPHVAGAAALYLQTNPWANPALVHAQVVNQATTNVIAGAPFGTPNRLLYSQL